jgi:hypothetical protein
MRKIKIDICNFQRSSPNHGVPVTCYVCGTEHRAFGLARIHEGRTTVDVPLCDPCLYQNRIEDDITRKFTKSPDLKIIDGIGDPDTFH